MTVVITMAPVDDSHVYLMEKACLHLLPAVFRFNNEEMKTPMRDEAIEAD
jgi:hypothetical protein